jgi:hypothetical protein
MLYPISVPKPDSAEDLIGYVDGFGRVVVKPSYAAGSYFAEGLASVCREDGSSGFIDGDGRTNVPFRFCGIGLFNEGLCPIGQGSKVGYVDRSGSWQIEPRFAVANRANKWGYIGRDGSVEIPLLFEGPRALGFSHGRAGVCIGGRWGFVDVAGDWAVMPQYEDVWRFAEGVASVRCDGKWGLVTQMADFG